jgi:hypothetical protein
MYFFHSVVEEFMKQFKLGLYLLGAAFAASLMVACAKSGGGGGEVLPTPVPVNPNLVFGGGKVAFFAQNSKMDRLYQNIGSSYTLHSGMYSVLKTAMRTCDRGNSNGGTASCQSWLNGFNDIMIFANGSQASSVQMVIRTMPDTSCQNPYYCSTYWYSLPSFKQFILGMFGFNAFNNSNVYNPMVLNMSIWPINNSKGFEMRGNAPGQDLYYNSGGLLFQFQVPEGKLEDVAWNFRLIFNGATAASGRMVRCPQPNCGVQGF